MDHYGPKNYTTDNGDTWVIGGKLILEDGASWSAFPELTAPMSCPPRVKKRWAV